MEQLRERKLRQIRLQRKAKCLPNIDNESYSCGESQEKKLRPTLTFVDICIIQSQHDCNDTFDKGIRHLQ